MLLKSYYLYLCCTLLAFTATAQKKIGLKDIFDNHIFTAKTIPGFHFMKKGPFYTQINDSGGLMRKNIITGRTDLLVRGDKLKTIEGESISLNDYTFSKDESKILINTDIHPIYRISYTAIPYVYNLETRKLYKVSDTPVMHATLSPDGKKIAYVRNNNLFYKELSNDKEIQITFDGKKNRIINGNCDWVYEEELGFSKAFRWSPGSDKIAYYRFDETKVPDYTLTFYRDTGNYPTPYTYKYPKAGEPVPAVSIHVYNLKTGKAKNMDIGEDTNQYIPRIKWTREDQVLCIYRMNRRQNELELLLNNVVTGESHVLYTDKAKWYINIFLLDDLYFLKDGKHFIVVNDEDGWRHAYLYDMKGSLITKLTPGNYSIVQVGGIDEKNKRLYYTAAYPDPMNLTLFSVDFRGKSRKQLTSAPGWHTVTFNPDCTYFLDNYSTINTPPVFTLKDQKGKVADTLEDNSALRNVMHQYALSKAHFLQVPNSDGVQLNAWMLRPPHFDSTKKYPVLFTTYGGPGGNVAINMWGGAAYFWLQMLAEKGYIIFSMDNTGTAFRGAKFEKKYTYLQLGWKEIHDQMDAAKWLRSHLNYVDSARIGFWGWSFGGLMSSLAITLGNTIFHEAIAVAPVTNWKYYDNIYTERYMRKPGENREGYEKTSPIKYADRLKGKFLIIQGTADDNVHFQNSILFSEALIQANKQFQQAYYPNKNHAIEGGNTRLQLFTRMTDFISKNL